MPGYLCHRLLVFRHCALVLSARAPSSSWDRAKTHLTNLYRPYYGLLLGGLLARSSSLDNVSLHSSREEKDSLVRSSPSEPCSVALRCGLLHPSSPSLPLWLGLRSHALSRGSRNGGICHCHYVSHLDGIPRLKRSRSLCSRSRSQFGGLSWGSHRNHLVQCGGLLWRFLFPLGSNIPHAFLPLRFPRKQRALKPESQ